jgi:tripartite-type tricarboxylate transporter receptor subunit TctC
MSTIGRRTLIKAGVGSALGLAFGGKTFWVSAQEWPAGVIKLIVPFPPGGTLDAIARLAVPGLQQQLGATVIVENRPGASGSIGTVLTAKSPPDGRTWLLVFDTHATNRAMQPSLTVDHDKDLDPVMLIGTAPNIIACHPSRPYQTVAALIAAAKVAPGKINYASAGTASLGHLTMLLLAKLAGLEWNHIPYKGAAPAVTDALAGHVDMIIAATTVLSKHIETKTLRPLAQTGASRHPTLPNVPTLVESGFPDLNATPWWGMVAPAKTPKPIIDRFNAAFAAALREESVAEKLRNSMGLTIVATGPEELRNFYRRQVDTWVPVVRDNALKAE